MNEEEKKAIERFKANANYCITSKETTQTILNLIKKQQKELEKKDKIIRKLQIECQKNFDLAMDTEIERIEANQIINKMAEMLVEDKEWFYSEFDNYTKQDFIEYFKNLVEKENK